VNALKQALNTYHSDHLFLLVGKNPLPNYVAARLLAKTDTTIWLLHSDDPDEGPSGTKRAAEELETALLKRELGLTVRLEGIPSSSNLGIETRIREILHQNRLAGTIGLNYTGGTKVMSVHVYRVLEQELAKHRPRLIFSYLDPRKLALRVDGHGTDSQRTFPIMQNPTLRQLVEISLDELLTLHGFEPAPARSTGWAKPDDELLDLCAAIAQVHATPTGFKQWRLWIRKERLQSLPDLKYYPQLDPVCVALDNLCGGQSTEDAVAKRLRPHADNPKLTSCDNWFRGVWLEEHSAACVRQVANKVQIYDIDQNLEYRTKQAGIERLELDVAATIGYQLFSISCQATQDRRSAKCHLFEVFVRSRQLGGDEARASLVCLLEDAKSLEKEVAQEWDIEGQLRVFGRHDLKDLATAFERWFETASQ